MSNPLTFDLFIADNTERKLYPLVVPLTRIHYTQDLAFSSRKQKCCYTSVMHLHNIKICICKSQIIEMALIITSNKLESNNYLSYCASSVFVLQRHFLLVGEAPPIPLNISCGDGCAFLWNTKIRIGRCDTDHLCLCRNLFDSANIFHSTLLLLRNR